jgi:hypothetical protein
MDKFNFKDYVSKNILLKENESPFSIDGWNEDFFYDLGLIDTIAEVDALLYEIKNAVRGSYATDGTIEDIADQLFKFADNFKEIGDQLMEMRDDFSGEELDEARPGYKPEIGSNAWKYQNQSGLKAAIDAADNEYDENAYDSVDDYLETYTGGYKDEVGQHLKAKYEG